MPKLTYCGVDKDAQTGCSGAEGCEQTRESQNTQSMELGFRGRIVEGNASVELLRA